MSKELSNCEEDYIYEEWWCGMTREYELVNYDCQDGECLMIHEKTTDSKLGALSLDHRSIGEEIINELNKLSQKLYDEQCRTKPIVLTTYTSDEH